MGTTIKRAIMVALLVWLCARVDSETFAAGRYEHNAIAWCASGSSADDERRVGV